jgi:hypothetical protein
LQGGEDDAVVNRGKSTFGEMVKPGELSPAELNVVKRLELRDALFQLQKKKMSKKNRQ